jgi:multiple sugar transport system permease protein
MCDLKRTGRDISNMQKKQLHQLKIALPLIIPFFLIYSIFVIYPILQGMILSFQDITLAYEKFVGLNNYQEMVNDSRFWNALKNTAFYSLFSALGFLISLSLALFMNSKIISSEKLRRSLESPLFLPMVITWVTLGITWRLLCVLFLPDFFRTLNEFLGMKVLPEQNPIGLTETSLWTVCLINLWASIGYNALLFLASLRQIPTQYYEAAIIDGADRFAIFRHVTIPLIKPMLIFMMCTTLIGSIQIFEPIQALTRGGPVWSTQSIVHYVVTTIISFYRPGYGAAMGVVVFAIIFVLSFIQFKVISKIIR